MTHMRDATLARHARDALVDAREDVRVAMRVDMRDREAARRQQRLRAIELGPELGFDGGDVEPAAGGAPEVSAQGEEASARVGQ
jgi:hypothetical protein